MCAQTIDQCDKNGAKDPNIRKRRKKIIASACACVVRECVRVSDREETEEVVSTKRKLKEGDERERGKKEEKKGN